MCTLAFFCFRSQFPLFCALLRPQFLTHFFLIPFLPLSITFSICLSLSLFSFSPFFVLHSLVFSILPSLSEDIRFWLVYRSRTTNRERFSRRISKRSREHKGQIEKRGLRKGQMTKKMNGNNNRFNENKHARKQTDNRWKWEINTSMWNGGYFKFSAAKSSRRHLIAVGD